MCDLKSPKIRAIAEKAVEWYSKVTDGCYELTLRDIIAAAHDGRNMRLRLRLAGKDGSVFQVRLHVNPRGKNFVDGLLELDK